MLKCFLFSFFVIFSCGVFGFLVARKNLILLLLAVEIMILSVNMNFLFISLFYDDLFGQIYVLLTLTIIAAETAFIVTLLVMYVKPAAFFESLEIQELKL